jgi:Tfp pilus assembly protein PilV
MSYEKLVSVIRGSFYETLIALALITIAFMALEPVVSRAAASTNDSFTITQTITGAIAFATAPGDVSMVGSIDGLTGGTSYGTTSVRITTNNATGYNMTIQFSSTTAMTQNASDGNDYINNYIWSTSTATYPSGFLTSVANGQFGFTVNASNTADISDVFTGNGTTDCGTGAGSTFALNTCWRGASSTNQTFETELLNTTAPTPASGSTSTVQFRVSIPNNPNPAISNGTYVATATLTATEN